jgi:hypothetical protein
MLLRANRLLEDAFSMAMSPWRMAACRTLPPKRHCSVNCAFAESLTASLHFKNYCFGASSLAVVLRRSLVNGWRTRA